ncbi:MAG: hypothetical protein ACLP5H_12405 [Desulfomonilaceae bacterium]
MKLIPAVCLAIIFALALFASSCSTLRSGNPVKAGYDVEKPAFDAEEGGWVYRNVPGVKALSNLVPPPSEARTKWDEWQKKKQEPWDARNNFN